jgi:small GTP-binding protein
MIGATGVGKTSLVRQFVKSIFSEKYHSTIGVKVDKKVVRLGDREVTMMLWDLQGEDDEFKIRPSFLRGASGYILVIDLTRYETLEVANLIQKMIETEFGKIPFRVLFNKNDLTDEIEITEQQMEKFIEDPDKIMRSSAKTGENVEKAFHQLAGEII